MIKGCVFVEYDIAALASPPFLARAFDWRSHERSLFCNFLFLAPPFSAKTHTLSGTLTRRMIKPDRKDTSASGPVNG